jgi:DNA-binding GntR family transcriptional regulator
VTPQHLAETLRRDIIGGVFLPGERLVEVDLAARYDCGRSQVRSAIVILEGEGLIEQARNRGATVRRITVDEALQIAQARVALESIAAADAARNRAEIERDALSELIEQMRIAVGDDDRRAYAALNASLHAQILQASHNTVVSELVTRLRNRAAPHQFRLSMLPGRAEESLGQHQAIVDAIVAGDAAAASAAMSKHLRSVVDVIEQWRSNGLV